MTHNIVCRFHGRHTHVTIVFFDFFSPLFLRLSVSELPTNLSYGVATISRLLKIIGLFRKRAL